MRRISTNYSNRLPDDFVAVVFTQKEVQLLTSFLDYCDPDDFPDKLHEFETNFKKLTEGDKWSES